MKKNKKIYKILLLVVIATYTIITLINQQKTLNLYRNNQKDLATQIDEQTEHKEELLAIKENVNSLEFIEEMAREKLDMYLPNERVYVDKGL